MKKLSITAFLLTVMLLASGIYDAEAQLRKDLPSAYQLTGPTLMTQGQQRSETRLFNLFNVSMGHSYEMSMSSFGGNVYNQNMYTNTLHLDFNESLQGRVDVAFAHSPFGQGMPSTNQTGQVFVRNAELNYAISDRAHIRFQFNQIPPGMGYHSGFGRHGFGHSPYYSRGHDPFYYPY